MSRAEAFQDRIDRLRGELNQSGNTKQYNAILQELKQLESQKDQLEEQTLAQIVGEPARRN